MPSHTPAKHGKCPAQPTQKTKCPDTGRGFTIEFGSPAGTESGVAGPHALSFITNTCTLASNAINVTLDTAKKTDLITMGATSSPKAFTITLNGCGCSPSGIQVQASLDFTPANGTTNVITNSATSGAASNVGIQILDSSNNPISNAGRADLGLVPAVGGSVTGNFTAQYDSLGDASGGNVQGTAQFTLIYQ